MKEKGLATVFLDLYLEHPAGWICARYKSSALLLLLLDLSQGSAILSFFDTMDYQNEADRKIDWPL